jgi:hypothetical protein
VKLRYRFLDKIDGHQWRVTFVPAKVTKTIRSGTPPCGFPAFLVKGGAKRTRDLRSLKHLFAFPDFACGTRWPSSRGYRVSPESEITMHESLLEAPEKNLC